MNPQRKVDIKWSSDFAYAIGLLTADGNLSKDGRHMDFTSKDKELVFLFRDCLRLKNEIGTKQSGYNPGGTLFNFQFSDVVFYNWLESIGLKPDKSKTLGRLDVHPDYFFDFARGYFDGDGSFYYYLDKRWENSFMFYTKFFSASKDYINWFRGELKDVLGITGQLNSPRGRNLYYLEYAKAESKHLIEKMYYSKEVPYLSRKKNKIDEALRLNNVG